MPTCKVFFSFMHHASTPVLTMTRDSTLHNSGSQIRLPVNEDGHQYLQVYFISSEDDQVDRQCRGQIGVTKNVIRQLQQFLNTNNALVVMFKTAMEKMNSDNRRFVFKPGGAPVGEHLRLYNAPTSADICALVVGDQAHRRDIVHQRRTVRALQRISETHRLYDALQYPIIIGRGNLDTTLRFTKMPNPITGLATNKNLSSMNFYAYRMKHRPNDENIILKCRRLFLQYAVDMYVKVESERLLFIKLNEAKQRCGDYIYLRDALNTDGNAQNLGQLVILPPTHVGSPRHMHEYAQDKFLSDEVEDIMSAEILDSIADPELHKIIITQMVHGPCGALNPKLSRMVDGICTKGYPRPLVAGTVTGSDRYPVYRRPTLKGQ